MAVPHLCCRTRKTGESKNPLLSIDHESTDDHLLIIQKMSAWNNKELLAVPVQRKFVNYAATGESQFWNTALRQNLQYEGDQLLAACNNIRQNLTWQDGKKCPHSYIARYGCPAYVAKHDSSTQYIRQHYMEFGFCSVALQFDLAAIPVGNFTSCQIYVRFRNSSYLELTPDRVGMGHNYSHQNWATYHYWFYDELPDPKDCTNTTAAVDFVTYSNDGKNTAENVPLSFGSFDPWDQSGYASYEGVLPYFTEPHDPTKPWVDINYDIQLTNDARTRLCEMIQKRRKIWMVVNPNFVNGTYSPSYTYGIASQVNVATWCQDVTIRFVVTSSKFNS